MKKSLFLITIATFIVACYAEAQVTGTFTDTRDNKTYKTVVIGTQVWMAENLAYKASSGCWAYNNTPSNVAIYGYLYTWEMAKNVCPTGWHLPSDNDWTTLTDYLGSADVAGGKLKVNGFNALPGGGYYNGAFGGLVTGGYWWSSTQTSGVPYDANEYAIINNNVNKTGYQKTAGFSVRCVTADLTLYELAKAGSIDACNYYIAALPNGKYITEVKKLILDINDKNAYLKASTDQSLISCNAYLTSYPDGKYITEVNKIIAEIPDKNAYLKASTDNTIISCNTYLTNYPNGKYVTEVNKIIVEIKEKQAKLLAKQVRDKKIITNSNKYLWKLGNKLCYEKNDSLICGTINQWNEDKSLAQIKIVTSSGGTYEGEELTKGNLIWVATSGKGWHLCLDEEIAESVANDKSGVSSATSTNSITSTSSDVGKNCYYLETVSYNTEGGLLGSYLTTSYTYKYYGVVESVLGENYKIIISNITIVDPSAVSYNYLKYKSDALQSVQVDIGKSFVKAKSLVVF